MKYACIITTILGSYLSGQEIKNSFDPANTKDVASMQATADFIRNYAEPINPYPYENTPISAMQMKAKYAVKELWVDMENEWNYYLTGVGRNVDLKKYGYSEHEYNVTIQRINKTTQVTEKWVARFTSDNSIGNIPNLVEFQNKFKAYIDWSQLEDGERFDVLPVLNTLISKRATLKVNSPNLFSNDILTNGKNNIYILDAGKFSTGGEYNIGIGPEALENNQNSGYNTAIGFRAMKRHMTGAGNIAIGMDAMKNSESCIDVTAIGFEAGANMISGVGATEIGRRALKTTLTAGGNTAIGDSAFYGLKYNPENGDGFGNVAIGYTAGEYNQTLKNSVLIGIATARNLTGGGSNVIIGSHAMFNRSEASANNTAIGNNVMYSSTGNDNVAIGSFVMTDIKGNSNIGIGYNAGNSIKDGQGNVIIGASAQSGSVDVSNAIVIGNATSATLDNQIVIGNENNSEISIAGVNFTREELIILKSLIANSLQKITARNESSKPLKVQKSISNADDDFTINNPVKDYLVFFTAKNIKKMSLYTADGRFIRNLLPDNLFVKDLITGFYFLKIILDNDEVLVKKISKA